MCPCTPFKMECFRISRFCQNFHAVPELPNSPRPIQSLSFHFQSDTKMFSNIVSVQCDFVVAPLRQFFVYVQIKRFPYQWTVLRFQWMNAAVQPYRSIVNSTLRKFSNCEWISDKTGGKSKRRCWIDFDFMLFTLEISRCAWPCATNREDFRMCLSYSFAWQMINGRASFFTALGNGWSTDD